MKKFLLMCSLLLFAVQAFTQINITANTTASHVQFVIVLNGIIQDGTNGTLNTIHPGTGLWTTDKTLTFANLDAIREFAQSKGVVFDRTHSICWSVRTKCPGINCVGNWSTPAKCYNVAPAGDGGGDDDLVIGNEGVTFEQNGDSLTITDIATGEDVTIYSPTCATGVKIENVDITAPGWEAWSDAELYEYVQAQAAQIGAGAGSTFTFGYGSDCNDILYTSLDFTYSQNFTIRRIQTPSGACLPNAPVSEYSELEAAEQSVINCLATLGIAHSGVEISIQQINAPGNYRVYVAIRDMQGTADLIFNRDGFDLGLTTGKPFCPERVFTLMPDCTVHETTPPDTFTCDDIAECCASPACPNVAVTLTNFTEYDMVNFAVNHSAQNACGAGTRYVYETDYCPLRVNVGNPAQNPTLQRITFAVFPVLTCEVNMPLTTANMPVISHMINTCLQDRGIAGDFTMQQTPAGAFTFIVEGSTIPSATVIYEQLGIVRNVLALPTCERYVLRITEDCGFAFETRPDYATTHPTYTLTTAPAPGGQNISLNIEGSEIAPPVFVPDATITERCVDGVQTITVGGTTIEIENLEFEGIGNGLVQVTNCGVPIDTIQGGNLYGWEYNEPAGQFEFSENNTIINTVPALLVDSLNGTASIMLGNTEICVKTCEQCTGTTVCDIDISPYVPDPNDGARILHVIDSLKAEFGCIEGSEFTLAQSPAGDPSGVVISHRVSNDSLFTIWAYTNELGVTMVNEVFAYSHAPEAALLPPFHDIQSFIITGGANVYGFQVDTLLKMYISRDAHGQLDTVITKEFEERTCGAQNETCVTKTTQKFLTLAPECKIATTGSQFTYAFPYTLVSDENCSGELDANNVISYPVGTTCTTTGTATANDATGTLTIQGEAWSATFEANTTITVQSGGLMDFRIDAAGPQETVFESCGSLCLPATTAVYASDLNTATGDFNLLQEAIINGTGVADGECYRLSVFDNSTLPPTLLQTFEGNTGDPVTALTNYSPLIFPDAGDVAGHGNVIQINKKELANALGLTGVDAITMTFQINAGGSWCDDPGLISNISEINEQDHINIVIHGAFDNVKPANLAIDNGDGTTSYMPFATDPTYGTNGGPYLSSSGWIVESQICPTSGEFLQQHDDQSLGFYVDWIVVDNRKIEYIDIFQPQIQSIVVHANEITESIKKTAAIPGLTSLTTNNYFDNCTERTNNYTIIAYDSANGELQKLRIISHESIMPQQFVEYDVSPMQFLNF